MDQKEQWIDEIMNSLDGLQRAKAPAGLQERVMKAIAKPKVIRLSPQVSWSLAAGLLLLISVNAFSLAHYNTERRTAMHETPQDFAREYYSSVSN